MPNLPGIDRSAHPAPARGLQALAARMSTASSEESSLLDAQAQQDAEWDDWQEEDDGGEGFRSLLSTEAQFGTLEQCLAHDKQRGFDLRSYRAQHGLDQVGTIRLVNFVRLAVAAGQDPLPALAAVAAGGAGPWEDDRFLQPVLADDELLFHDWEEEEEGGEAGQQAVAGGRQQRAGAGEAAPAQQQQQVEALRQENEALREMVEALRSVVLQQEDEGVRELLGEAQAAAAAAAGGAGPSTTPQAAQQPAAPGQGKPKSEAARRIDDSYFESYSAFDIHREMLSDKVRTDAYRDALEKNPSLLRGARVLDVGCGTGILSMFAARAGAASVVAIDGSAQIAGFARQIAEANGLAAESGGPITVVSSKIEELAALPAPPAAASAGAAAAGGSAGSSAAAGQQVDVIVSEWMGYALLFESMLESVLHARDRWLRPGGAILPDVARVHLAAAGEGASGLGFWSEVYGFSMEPVREHLFGDGLKRAVVRPVAPEHLISEPVCLQSFDLATMSPADQDFTAHFRLTVGAGPQACHALVLWFDTLFTDRFCKDHPVELSTSPYGPQTHWVQTVLLLKQPVQLVPAAVAAVAAEGASEPAAVALAGQLSISRSRQTHRSLDIVLRYTVQHADGGAGPEQVCMYTMGVEA